MAERRAAFPRDEIEPNDNDPAAHQPGTVGSPDPAPGDPHGIEFQGDLRSAQSPPRIIPSAWAGWPSEWDTPSWFGQVSRLTDTAWTCLDDNSSILSTMPPYLVGASSSLDADWINNPDPEQYTSWEEFAKQLFWDFQGHGEAFVLCTARYSSDWPARFHVLPPWSVSAEMRGDGTRRYTVGSDDVTADVLHVRYTSRVGDAHGHGPLEVGGPRMVAAEALARYARNLAVSGGVPNAVLTHPNRLSADQAADLQAHWVNARMSSIGLPAVLSGGLQFEALQFNPKDLALVELAQWNEARIAVLLKVPPFCVALPSGGDPMTYSNVNSLFDYRWRAGLKPLAAPVMAALSYWALPRGTTVELNRDEFVQPALYERAQTWQILHGIVDAEGNPVMSVDDIKEKERLGIAAPSPTLSSGVLQ